MRDARERSPPEASGNVKAGAGLGSEDAAVTLRVQAEARTSATASRASLGANDGMGIGYIKTRDGERGMRNEGIRNGEWRVKNGE